MLLLLPFKLIRDSAKRHIEGSTDPTAQVFRWKLFGFSDTMECIKSQWDTCNIKFYNCGKSLHTSNYYGMKRFSALGNCVGNFTHMKEFSCSAWEAIGGCVLLKLKVFLPWKFSYVWYLRKWLDFQGVRL